MGPKEGVWLTTRSRMKVLERKIEIFLLNKA